MTRRPFPEPEPPESDPELEETIAELIRRKYAVPEGSAAYRLVMRELAGLRYSRELAGPIMEDLDPEWGAFSDDLGPAALDPEGKVLRLRRPLRRT